MSGNKTKPTDVNVSDFLRTVSDQRKTEAEALIAVMRDITGEDPVMWGPSIIGFGTQHYQYDTGREGDMPRLGFSPRKANITIYFSEGFDRYRDELMKLGKYTQSVSCLYIKKLADVDLEVLRRMLERSYRLAGETRAKPTTVDEYVASVPVAARETFDELRRLVQGVLPHAQEVMSYGIVGYKVDDKRARVFVSGWKDHVAMYPIPRDDALQKELAPYIKGKGTLWFDLDTPLPKSLIEKTVRALAS